MHNGAARSQQRTVYTTSFLRLFIMDDLALASTIEACRLLISDRFPDDENHGAAAMLLDDGTILTGTAPQPSTPRSRSATRSSPSAARTGSVGRSPRRVCLHRQPGGRTVVLSPCGVCRERLAVHGPDVLVAVADPLDACIAIWKPLKDVLPNYWMTAFPEEISPGWSQ